MCSFTRPGGRQFIKRLRKTPAATEQRPVSYCDCGLERHNQTSVSANETHSFLFARLDLGLRLSR